MSLTLIHNQTRKLPPFLLNDAPLRESEWEKEREKEKKERAEIVWIKWIDAGRLRQSVNTSTTRLNQSVSSTPTSWFNKLWCLVFFCRWQYGFRDLSIPEVELSRKKKKDWSELAVDLITIFLVYSYEGIKEPYVFCYFYFLGQAMIWDDFFFFLQVVCPVPIVSLWMFYQT